MQFCVSDFGCKVSDFGFKVYCSGLRVSSPWFRVRRKSARADEGLLTAARTEWLLRKEIHAGHLRFDQINASISREGVSGRGVERSMRALTFLIALTCTP